MTGRLARISWGATAKPIAARHGWRNTLRHLYPPCYPIKLVAGTLRATPITFRSALLGMRSASGEVVSGRRDKPPDDANR